MFLSLVSSLLLSLIGSDEPAISPASTWREDGYRGIWYANEKLKSEYVYKYSGGLGTYCAKHIPMACYDPVSDKTFFCYGGTRKGENRLLEMVSFYDHKTGTVPRPVALMDKGTDDAHDNPVISLDDQGLVWVFASSHGTARPSYVFKSREPRSIEAFDRVWETHFSYPQPWFLPGRGFLFLHTRYSGGRGLHWITSRDGLTWSDPLPLAKIDQGHYQVSWRWRDKVGTAFDFHPNKLGLNHRTNLYYLETEDMGQTWRTAEGTRVEVPLTEIRNPALVHDYQSEGKLVYVKDLNFDAEGRPILLFVTSKGFECGPENGPRVWTTAHWNGASWDIQGRIESGNNYDTGCLHVERGGDWRIIGPTQTGAQPYNPGGEIAIWTNKDEGRDWKRVRQATAGSPYNHTHARRPVNAHPDFYAFWADGDCRKPSESRLYFCNKTGRKVYRLPTHMESESEKPIRVRKMK